MIIIALFDNGCTASTSSTENPSIYPKVTNQRDYRTRKFLISKARGLMFVSIAIVCACLVTWSCPTLCDLMDCSPPGSSVHGDSPGKSTGVGCRALLQGIFPTRRSNPGLLYCRWILYCLSHRGSLRAIVHSTSMLAELLAVPGLKSRKIITS